MTENEATKEIFAVLPFGDGAIHVQFGHGINEQVCSRVRKFCERVHQAQDSRIIEFVPAYHSVTLFYGPGTTYSEMLEWVHKLNAELNAGEFLGIMNERAETGYDGLLIEIPVCYGGEHGPDLEFVAGYHGLSSEEVITLHSKAEYIVHMLGFMPGFPYMGGLDPALATPRLSKPRTLVPQGSVGIAGGQTGIYPLRSPGGWQLIGRTPLKLFKAELDPPAFLRAGDRIRFKPISIEEYRSIQNAVQSLARRSTFCQAKG